MLVARDSRYSRRGTLGLLSGLAAGESQGVTVYLPPGLTETALEALIADVIGPGERPPGLAETAATSPTGAAIFWGQTRRLMVRPPFPLAENLVLTGMKTAPLEALLERDHTIGLVLVRLGRFAVGVCRGEHLIASKTGSGLVHGRHRKGGSSQRRFERRREKQVEVFLERVCGHAEQQLAPHVSDIEHLVYGGAWTTIMALQKTCPFLARFRDRTLPSLLDIAQPRQATLQHAVSAVWCSRVTEWSREETDTATDTR